MLEGDVALSEGLLLKVEELERRLNRSGEARREEVGRQLRVHRQQLVLGAGGQLDASFDVTR